MLLKKPIYVVITVDQIGLLLLHLNLFSRDHIDFVAKSGGYYVFIWYAIISILITLILPFVGSFRKIFEVPNPISDSIPFSAWVIMAITLVITNVMSLLITVMAIYSKQ